MLSLSQLEILSLFSRYNKLNILSSQLNRSSSKVNISSSEVNISSYEIKISSFLNISAHYFEFKQV